MLTSTSIISYINPLRSSLRKAGLQDEENMSKVYYRNSLVCFFKKDMYKMLYFTDVRRALLSAFSINQHQIYLH